jgi:hypothetical protein
MLTRALFRAYPPRFAGTGTMPLKVRSSSGADPSTPRGKRRSGFSRASSFVMSLPERAGFPSMGKWSALSGLLQTLQVTA